MVTAVQRLMERRQIDALIKSDPIHVTFYRKLKISTPDGGWKWATDPTPILPGGKPQEVFLQPFKRRMTEFLVNTELGDVPDLPYILIGRWNLDIEKDDYFFWQGDKFEVKTLDFKQDIRIAAQVDYYGGTLNG